LGSAGTWLAPSLVILSFIARAPHRIESSCNGGPTYTLSFIRPGSIVPSSLASPDLAHDADQSLASAKGPIASQSLTGPTPASA